MATQLWSHDRLRGLRSVAKSQGEGPNELRGSFCTPRAFLEPSPVGCQNSADIIPGPITAGLVAQALLCEAARHEPPASAPVLLPYPAQRESPTLGASGVSGSLPQRAAPPGPGRPPDRPRSHGRRDARASCLSFPPRRAAPPLQPASCLNDGLLPPLLHEGLDSGSREVGLWLGGGAR